MPAAEPASAAAGEPAGTAAPGEIGTVLPEHTRAALISSAK